MNQMPEFRKRLDGKVAIITGATGSLARGAKRFLDEDASVMLVGRSAETLHETTERLAANERSAGAVAVQSNGYGGRPRIRSVESTIEPLRHQ